MLRLKQWEPPILPKYVNSPLKCVCLGKNVLIVEDIIDTGKTMNKLLNTLREIFLKEQIFGSKSIMHLAGVHIFLKKTLPNLFKNNFSH